MQTLELSLGKYQSPPEVLGFLNEHDIKSGDTLKVTTEEGRQAVIMALMIIVVLALVHYYNQKKKREEDGEKILAGLAGLFKEGITMDEIAKQVEEEYGIKIEMETKPDEEREFWHKLAAQNLSKAYSADEPDYSDVTLMEPNPNYKPWSKDM